MIFEDRFDAGQRLAQELLYLKDLNPVVLALPRGGVPVAYEVAKALQAPLDLLFVRKIGHPENEEFGIGNALFCSKERGCVGKWVGVNQ